MIRLGGPAVDDREIAAVSEALRSGVLSTGEIVGEFESDCAAIAGRETAAAVSSGSVALELALNVSDLSDGAGIVVSPYNCAAVLYSILHEDLVPVFADIDPMTFNLDPEAVEAAIKASAVPIEAVLVAHLFGQPSKMDEIERVAEHHGLVLIDDFAQAIGAKFRGQLAGSFGDMGVASFGATKNVTTAEGGVVVSDDTQLIDRIRTLRSNTNPPVAGETLRSVRMNDLEAAIGREQVKKYDDIVGRKRAVASLYDGRLEGIVETPTALDDRTHVYHGYPIRSPLRDDLSSYLGEHDIESTAVYDTPLYDYSHVESPADNEVAFPHTERAASEVLLLPIHGSLTTDDARTVADTITNFFENEA